MARSWRRVRAKPRHHRASQRRPGGSAGRSGGDGYDAATDLIQLDALEQGLEVAVAEPLIALALDDLKEDRPEQVFGEDLQQQAFVADGAVDEDAVPPQPFQVLAVARHALVDQLVIGLDG